MPELPEVETVCKGLRPVLVGQKVQAVEQRRPDLRFPFPDNFVKTLKGATITDLSRRAKYILAHLDKGQILVMHLGMSGRFSIIEKNGEEDAAQSPNPAHDHVVFRMKSGAEIRYNDPRRFGFMILIKGSELNEHKFFRNMGIEPLGDEFSPAFLAKAAFEKTTSLKAFLLNQQIVAGLGNIYVCEALHRAKLSPKDPASVLANKKGKDNQKSRTLVPIIKSVLKEAIDAGGSTLKDHRQADGSLGYFQHTFAVYGREGAVCTRAKCTGLIQRITQNGRSTFYCAKCQRSHINNVTGR